MRFQAIACTAILFAAIASAQTPDKLKAQCADIEQRNLERLSEGLRAVHPLTELCYPEPKAFGFTSKPSPEGLQQIAALLRTIVQLTEKQISADAEASTITLRGTPGELEMADWLVKQLDQPAYTPGQRTANISMPELPVPLDEQSRPDRNDEVLRVFFLAHTDTQPGYQEMLATLRVVSDIIFAAGDTEQFALAVRAPAAQADLVGYLIQALDVAPGSPKSIPEFAYRAPESPLVRPLPSANVTTPKEVVRVFYPTHATEAKALAQIDNAIHTVAGIKHAFMDVSVGAIAVRGSANDLATAAWLIQALDVPTAGGEFYVPGAAQDESMIRVFLLSSKMTPTGLQTALNLLSSKQPDLKLASYATYPALIVRGSASQIAQAEHSILELSPDPAQ